MLGGVCICVFSKYVHKALEQQQYQNSINNKYYLGFTLADALLSFSLTLYKHLSNS